MKTLKISALLLFVLSAGLWGANAQTYSQFHESYAITVEQLTASEGTTDVSYAIDVFPSKVRRTESVLVQVYLANGADNLMLNSFQINGRARARAFERARALGRVVEYKPIDHVLSAKGGSGVIRYDNTFPYEDWMDGASLYVHETVSRCLNCRTENTFALNALTVIPPAPPVVEPAPVVIPEPQPQPSIKEATGSIIFPQNGTRIDFNLDHNWYNWATAVKLLNQIESSDNSRLIGIELRGYASPEGPYAHNESLAADRARVVREELLNTVPGLSPALITSSSVAEDWDGLVEMLERTEIPQRQEVLDIINTVGIFDGRETALMKLSGGSVFRTLLRDFFPPLRRTEYRIIYEEK